MLQIWSNRIFKRKLGAKSFNRACQNCAYILRLNVGFKPCVVENCIDALRLMERIQFFLGDTFRLLAKSGAP